jgi:hypothetical protein
MRRAIHGRGQIHSQRPSGRWLFTGLLHHSNVQQVLDYLQLLEAEPELRNLAQRHPCPRSTFLHDRHRVSGNGTQKYVISRSVRHVYLQISLRPAGSSFILNSSAISRIAASGGFSPSSAAPPGKFHMFGYGIEVPGPSSRRCMRMIPFGRRSSAVAQTAALVFFSTPMVRCALHFPNDLGGANHAGSTDRANQLAVHATRP